MEIELKWLALPLWKLSPKHSISVQPSLKLTRIFFLVLPFLFFSKCRPTLHFQAPKTHEQIKSKTNQTHSPYFYLRIAWSFRCLGLVRSAPGLLGFCIVAATRHVPSLHFVSPEAFVAWVWSDRRLGCWVFASTWWRDTSNLYVLHRLKLSPPGFGQNRHLGCWVLHRCFFLLRCSSLRFELSRLLGFVSLHLCVTKSSPLGSVSMNENWVQ